jgi:hypothetical protein
MNNDLRILGASQTTPKSLSGRRSKLPHVLRYQSSFAEDSRALTFSTPWPSTDRERATIDEQHRDVIATFLQNGRRVNVDFFARTELDRRPR